MPNPTRDFEPTERELHSLLGEPNANPEAHPSPQLLRAFGQEVLSPEIEHRLEQHLRRCRTCSMLRADLETLPELPLSDLQSKRIAAGLPNAPASTAAFGGIRLIPWASGIAALLLLTAGAFYFMSSPRDMQSKGGASGKDGSTMATASAPAPAPVSIAALDVPVRPLAPPSDEATTLQTRGTASRTPPTAALMPAFVAYRRGDYASAAKRFKRLAVSYPSSDLVSLYLGVALLLDHQDEAAFASLQRARKLAPRSDAAQWYSAVAALRVHSAEAKSLFETLCGESSSAYSADSCRIAASLH